MSSCDCGCKLKYNLIFACSGAADVGSIADLAARKLAAEKSGKMSCIAGISAGDAEILQWAGNATRIAVIDGCDKDCASKTLKAAGFHDFGHIRVTSLGMEKGKTPVTPERIGAVCEEVKKLLSEGEQVFSAAAPSLAP